jgi:hypothetical protein
MSHGNEGSVRAILYALGALSISGAQLVERINAVEARMQERFPTAKWVFFEPDVR